MTDRTEDEIRDDVTARLELIEDGLTCINNDWIEVFA